MLVKGFSAPVYNSRIEHNEGRNDQQGQEIQRDAECVQQRRDEDDPAINNPKDVCGRIRRLPRSR